MKSLLFSLLLIVSLMFAAEAGFACSCAPPRSAAEELERAAAVFSGKVVEIKKHKQAENIFTAVEVIFRVERSWKGAEGETVSVFTSGWSAACGYGFKGGRTYLVYAHRDAEGRLSTSTCSRTRRLKDAREDLEEMGAGREMAEDAPEGLGRGESPAAPDNVMRLAPAGSQNVSRRSGGRVTVTGRLTGEGVECQAFRSKGGKLYTLAGNLRGFKAGDRVRVVGRVAEISMCMQGTTLSVESIRRIK